MLKLFPVHQHHRVKKTSLNWFCGCRTTELERERERERNIRLRRGKRKGGNVFVCVSPYTRGTY